MATLFLHSSMKFTLVLKFVVELFDFSMVSAEKYSMGTAVRWLLIGDGMRAIECTNVAAFFIGQCYFMYSMYSFV